MSSNVKQPGIRLVALAVGSGALFGLAGARDSIAQEQSDSDSDEVVVVTGSHIRRDEFTSSSPIEVISAETAELEGLIDTADMLQSTSVAAGSVQFNNRYQNWTVEGGTGVQTVSLRGLGAQRGLVLVNGRRSGPAGVRGQVASFDLNVIPISIVDRVEILKDGASSIYGSDAVAGVVNILTRTNVSTPEVSFNYTMPGESGGESFSLSGATGFDFARGSVVIAAQVDQRDAIRLADRDYLACQRDSIRDAAGNLIDRDDRGINSGTPFDGCENLYGNTAIDFFTNTRYIEAPDGVTIGPLPGYRPRTNDTYDGGGQAYYEDQIFFPFANETMVQNETTRSSLYLSSDLEFDALGGVNWRNELLVNQRETRFERWEQFFPFIGSAPDFPYANDPAYTNSLEVPVAIAVVPFKRGGAVDVDYQSLSSSLEGEFSERLAGWTWTLDAIYSYSDGSYGQQDILKSQSGDVLFDDDAPVFDYMSPEILRGEYGSGFMDAVGRYTLGQTTYEQYILSGVVTGDVGRLPGGEVAVAFGAEYRDFSIDDQPDQASQDDDIWGSSSAQVTAGQDSVSEIFGEIELPLVASRKGVESLSLDLSARAFDYKSYGSDSVWKAGINWQMIPALRIRATEGTSFRAPALYELFLGNQTGFLPQPQIDPCIDWGNSANENIRANCAAAGIPSDFVGGSTAALIIDGGGAGFLEAETSEASTIGIVITPPKGNVSVALDYFQIDIEDEVARLGADSILGGCYGAPVYPNEFCNLFTRDSGANPGSPDAFGVVEIHDTFLNINRQVTEGWDLTLQYQRQFGFGRFLVEAQGTYTLEDVINLFDPNLSAGFATDDFNGSIGEPSFVANLRFAIERNEWSFNWFVDFINGMDNSIYDTESFNYYGFDDARRVITTPSMRYHDVSVRWEGGPTAIVFGVRNLTDEDPPSISKGQALRWGNIPYFGSQYDLLGRAAFMTVTRQF